MRSAMRISVLGMASLLTGYRVYFVRWRDGVRGWLDLGQLDFGVEVEEGVEGEFELGLDGFAAAFEDVHGDVGLIAVFELDGSFADCGDFIGREETHAVDEGEICHSCDCFMGASVRGRGRILLGCGAFTLRWPL